MECIHVIRAAGVVTGDVNKVSGRMHDDALADSSDCKRRSRNRSETSVIAIDEVRIHVMRTLVGHIKAIATRIGGDVHRTPMRPCRGLAGRTDRSGQRVHDIFRDPAGRKFCCIEKFRRRKIDFGDGNIYGGLADSAAVVPCLHDSLIRTGGKIDVGVESIRIDGVCTHTGSGVDPHRGNSLRTSWTSG